MPTKQLSVSITLYPKFFGMSTLFQKMGGPMEIILDDGDEGEEAEPEVIDGILTFDELLEDDYYKSEFERRVQQRLEEYSHPDVKGGENMEITEEVQKTEEGKVITKQEFEGAASQPTVESPAPAGDPAAEKTDAEKAEESKEEVAEPAREMTAEQYAEYNETLRRVSKTVHTALAERYNAFEDGDVKAIVKQAVMEGRKPDIAEITADIVKRHAPSPAEEPTQPEPQTEEKEETEDTAAEVTALKVENALLKEGIIPERADAATKLFIAEGGDLGKVKEWIAKYPEWHRTEGDVVFTKAPPVGGKTAPTPADHRELNDFEKKVAEARKKRGLD